MQHATQEAAVIEPLLSVQMNETDLPRFVTVLQYGFLLEIPKGETIIEILQTLPGFSSEFIANRLQTIFYNGDAIDDLDQTVTGPEATLALSAAMPGLAGAILRRNSPHAALRKTRSSKTSKQTDSAIVVRIKLFNTVAVERGPELCCHGIRLVGSDLATFLALRPAVLQSIRSIKINNKAVKTDHLIATLRSLPTVLLQIKT